MGADALDRRAEIMAPLREMILWNAIFMAMVIIAVSAL